MFQRLKGAIDSRIAEEQARQRSVIQSASPSRSGSVSALTSPPKRPRAREKANLSTEKNPDPSEFDSDFAAGEEAARDDASKDESSGHNEEQSSQLDGPLAGLPESNVTMDNEGAATPATRVGELPTAVRVKLRKLDRLEGKYQELLGAYRVAHARVQTIEPFEASLRENTPLTSINDPGALVEYLNQVTLKSDMVLDELRRVTMDRDGYRKRFDESDKETQALKDEITKLKHQAQTSHPTAEQSASSWQSYNLSNAKDSITNTADESSVSVKSRTPSTSSRIPSFSLFSPKSKAVKSPSEEKDTSEEFFSYDNELPRLENELQEKQTEIADLMKQLSTLQADLSVARESTEGMVQSLEGATRELHALRDANERHESTRSELQVKVEGLEQEISSLTSYRTTASQENSSLGSEVANLKALLEQKEGTLSGMNEAKEEMRAQVAALERDALELHQRVDQKEATVKDLEDSLAMHQVAERDQAQQSRSASANEKQIGILNNIMDSLRSQLKTAEGEITELKEVRRKAENQIENLLEPKAHHDNQEEACSKLTGDPVDRHVAQIDELPSTKYFGFVNHEEFALSGDATTAFRQFSDTIRKTRPELYEALIAPEKSSDKSTLPSETGAVPCDTTKKSKKKKKKNKGGQGSTADQTIHEPPAKVTETLDEAEENTQVPDNPQLIATHDLEKRIKDLECQIAEKVATVDQLSTQLKDQDALNEELEMLRDDLLHQGEEHVQARDALKAARIEKLAIEERVAELEKELADVKARSMKGSVESNKVHDAVLSELNAVQAKCDAWQTDAIAAEQLAASRFKDITDLQELLSKAQPELKSLRSEVEELKQVKDDLKNKIGELARLESRYEDLKADMKNLSRRIGEKDAEIKDLRQKLAEEKIARTQVEEELGTARSDLQSTEAAKKAALASEKQTSDELLKARADFSTSRSTIRELEEVVSKHLKENEKLKEEISLKTSLHDSTQAILTGLREQTLELSTQAREASSRAESLEEELAEAQRMLSERTREGETMRRLLADAEGRTSSKIRELKERMETAIEERDRIEDEASTSNRRMAREVEDLRNKSREAIKSLKAMEDLKEELERSQKDLKQRRDDLENAQERARAEVAEAQAALKQLREALDQREREGMDLERQKADTKRMLDEFQERVEKLQKANKGLTEELKNIQQQRKGSVRPSTIPRSEVPSSRSSLDSSGANPRNDGVVGSPVPNIRDRLPGSGNVTPTGPNPSAIDYVYLKNVLLWFLEEKDKGHREQLIPVLGKLLKFDPKDEQKWMAAITAK